MCDDVWLPNVSRYREAGPFGISSRHCEKVSFLLGPNRTTESKSGVSLVSWSQQSARTKVNRYRGIRTCAQFRPTGVLTCAAGLAGIGTYVKQDRNDWISMHAFRRWSISDWIFRYIFRFRVILFGSKGVRETWSRTRTWTWRWSGRCSTLPFPNGAKKVSYVFIFYFCLLWKKCQLPDE